MVCNSGDMINMSRKGLSMNLKLYFFPCFKQAQDTQSLMAWVNALRDSNPEKDVSDIYLIVYSILHSILT